MKYPSDTGMEVLGLFCGTSLGTFFEMLWSHMFQKSFLMTSKTQ